MIAVHYVGYTLPFGAVGPVLFRLGNGVRSHPLLSHLPDDVVLLVVSCPTTTKLQRIMMQRQISFPLNDPCGVARSK